MLPQVASAVKTSKPLPPALCPSQLTQPMPRSLVAEQVYNVLLDGVQPYAAKVIDLGSAPEVQSTFLRVRGKLGRELD